MELFHRLFRLYCKPILSKCCCKHKHCCKNKTTFLKSETVLKEEIWHVSKALLFKVTEYRQ